MMKTIGRIVKKYHINTNTEGFRYLFLVRLQSSVFILALVSGCASAPKLDQIPIGETVSIVVAGSPTADGQTEFKKDSSAGENIIIGAGGGAMGGVVLGSMCGFMAPVCIPMFATWGAGLGGAAGAIASTGGNLSTEQATQLGDRMLRLNESHDKLAELATNINDRAARYWDLSSTEPQTTVRVGVQNLIFASTQDNQVRAILQVSVTVKKKSDKPLRKEEVPVVKGYEYASPYASLDLWLDDENDLADTSISIAIRQISNQIVSDLASSSNTDETVQIAKVQPQSISNGASSAFIDISGTYVSEITSGDYLVLTKQQQTMKLIVKHEGDSLKAYNNQYDLEIIGEVVGNKVSFYTLPSKISSIEITGTWEVDVDSGGITGRWKLAGSGFQGQWNLSRTPTVTEVEYTSSGEKYTESIETPVLASESSPGDEKSALDYPGQAEEEINTQSYDKNLWDRALVETGGDQNKTKARYIELRANQLYSEKIGSVSDASLYQQANPINASTQINLSGTYVSDITSNSHHQFTKRYQKLRVTFEQNGNKFTATDDKNDIKIDGIIVDNTIRFYVLAGPAIGAYDVEGEWNVSLDGKKLEGFWEAPNSYDWAAGTWTLNKVE